MTEQTYNRIAEIYNQLLANKDDPLTIRMEEHSEKYWKLSSSLSKEHWNIVNDCFCCFHAFYMKTMELALEGE